jgi:hypothetical protein
MQRERPERSPDPGMAAPASAPRHEMTDEILVLGIEELEPRLTPDGYFSSGTPHHSSPPPDQQVGWGC